MQILNDISFGTIILGLIYIINVFLIFAVIFIERKSPTATFAWILLLAFVPVIGFFVYIIINQNFARYQINKLTSSEEYVFEEVLDYQIENIETSVSESKKRYLSKWLPLIKLNQVYGKGIFMPGNDIKLFTDGKEFLNDLMNEIENAKTSICMEFFIMKWDKVGKLIIDLLAKKAKEGVEVRLLLDSQGSHQINNIILKEYLDAGGKIGYFLQPKLHKLGIKYDLKLNYRNHRKIVVIDDKMAYTGGYNLAKEYIGEKKKFGYWRDDFVKIKGNSVISLKQRFVLDWRFTVKEQLSIVESDFKVSLKNDESYMQVVSCGPEDPKEEIKRGFMKMITLSENSIYIQTPYFVPDASILESLKMACLSGVDVNIMIPSIPDHLFVYWATYSYIGELLRDGAHVYIYDNGFLHAKTIFCDSEVCSIGSTNFDRRSFKLNFETNAFIYDPKFTKELEEAFHNDLKYSHELTYEEYKKRTKTIKFKEAISRLLSDFL